MAVINEYTGLEDLRVRIWDDHIPRDFTEIERHRARMYEVFADVLRSAAAKPDIKREVSIPAQGNIQK